MCGEEWLNVIVLFMVPGKWRAKLPAQNLSILEGKCQTIINSPIIVIILSHFTALVWSAGDKKELLKCSNTDKRGFLRCLFFCTISICMWDWNSKLKGIELQFGLLNMHLLSANMLVCAFTMYTHALKMAFVDFRLCHPVIFYSGHLYMSISSLASLYRRAALH